MGFFLEYIQKSKYDLIVTDLKMPKMDGLELIDHIYSKSNYIPGLIVLTANYDSKHLFIKQKDVKILPKPFDINELFGTIKNILA